MLSLFIFIMPIFAENVATSSDQSKLNGSLRIDCGNITGIPVKIPKIVSEIVLIIQILVPVILVIYGSIDLVKGIIASKEDEIKSGQRVFIKRLILGAIVFFIVVIVKFLVSILDSSNNNNYIGCIDCFISNQCKSAYFVSSESESYDNGSNRSYYNPKTPKIPTITPSTDDSAISSSTDNPIYVNNNLVIFNKKYFAIGSSY